MTRYLIGAGLFRERLRISYLWALDTERENIKDCRYKLLDQGKFREMIDKGNELMDALPPMKRLVNTDGIERIWKSK